MAETKQKNYFRKYPEKYNSYSKLYRTFSAMVDRCRCKTTTGYKNYGGRGIKVCDEWVGNYMAFVEWSLANGYKEGLELDRIDVNGNYCPENCRWITHKQNNNNKRYNRLLTYNGETHTMAEWAEILNIKFPTLSYRVQSGWSDEKALTTPIDKQKSLMSKRRHQQIKELKGEKENV